MELLALRGFGDLDSLADANVDVADAGADAAVKANVDLAVDAIKVLAPVAKCNLFFFLPAPLAMTGFLFF